MTVEELHCLSRLLKSLARHTGQPVTTASLRSILEYSFDGWDTTHDVGIPPSLAERTFYECRILASTLSQDHPLPAGRTRPRQPVFFGIGLQYEDGTVDWGHDRINALPKICDPF